MDESLKYNLQGKAKELKEESINFGQIKQLKQSVNADLKSMFHKALGRLNDNATKEIAFAELKQMIKDNHTKEDLKFYLSSLSIFYKNCSPSAKEIQVLLLGFIASVYKENLLDGNNTSILTVVKRMIDIIKIFMKDNNFGIQKACSHSMLELLHNCMIKDDYGLIISMFFDPMVEIIISGSNLFAQTTATICINDQITYYSQNKFEKVVLMIYPRLLQLIKKSNCDSNFLFESFYTTLSSIKFKEITEELREIYERLSFFAINTQNFQTKIEICKTLGFIAIQLYGICDSVLGIFSREVIFTLQSLLKDKSVKVQAAANLALKEWYKLENKFNELESKKMKEVGQNTHYCESASHKMNFFRDLAKANKALSPDRIKEEIYTKGISNLLRTTNFMKKRENSLSNSKIGMSNKKASHKELNRSGLKEYVVRNFKNANDIQGDLLYTKGNDQKIRKDKIEQSNESLSPKNDYSSPRNENSFKMLLNKLNKEATWTIDSFCNSIDIQLNSKLSLLDEKLNKIESKIIQIHHQNKGNNFESTVKDNENNSLSNKINKNGHSYRDSDGFWSKVIKDINDRKYNDAYENVLSKGDDTLLLRLLLITGPILNKLNLEVSKKLLYKYNLIARSNIIVDIGFKLINQCYEINLFHYLNDDFKNQLLDTLYQNSKIEDQIGQKSQDLYQKILDELN